MLPFVFNANAQSNAPTFADLKAPFLEWCNDNGKRVDAPQVNFAGKYYIAVHAAARDADTIPLPI